MGLDHITGGEFQKDRSTVRLHFRIKVGKRESVLTIQSRSPVLTVTAGHSRLSIASRGAVLTIKPGHADLTSKPLRANVAILAVKAIATLRTILTINPIAARHTVSSTLAGRTLRPLWPRFARRAILTVDPVATRRSVCRHRHCRDRFAYLGHNQRHDVIDRDANAILAGRARNRIARFEYRNPLQQRLGRSRNSCPEFGDNTFEYGSDVRLIHYIP
jgi:hypothetical protein